MQKHWTRTEKLHLTVSNPNIHIQGTHSYYSDYWDQGFETSVVRYLHGDEQTRHTPPPWPVDQLYIGNYVCIGAEAVILMGANHTHRTDWLCLYPFMETIGNAYQSKGDTYLNDNCWIGMRAMIMPGISVGEGAVVAANAVVTKDVPAYSIVAGNPAKIIKYRFEISVINRLLSLQIYRLPEEQVSRLVPYLSSDNIDGLIEAMNQLVNTRD